jgi:AAA15 family ATPase/GTPase
MIVQFSVENYKSFKNETVLSFIGSNTTKEHEPDNIFKWKEYKFLKSNAIYGANASGKSNLISAIADMKGVVLTSFQNALNDNIRQKSIQPFKLNVNTKSGASIFEIVFIQDGKQFRYGFEIQDEQIISEWLFHIPSKIESALFTREGNKIHLNKTQFKEGLKLEEKTRENVLFLSVCSQFNGEISNSVIKWFKNLRFISGINDDSYRRYTTEKIKNDKKFSLWLNKFIGFLEISKLSVEDELIETINIDDLDIPDDKKEWKVALEAINAIQEKEKTITKLKSWHNIYDDTNILNDTMSFDFNREESKGTQKLVYILGPIYDALINSRVLIIDELDSRLHTLLSKHLIFLFHKFNRRNSQFAFVLQDTNILKTEIFRRDQLWFVEKNQFGVSDFYSLHDYGKVRKDAKFEQAYLKGSYGAIPQIEIADDLIETLYGEE